MRYKIVRDEDGNVTMTDVVAPEDTRTTKQRSLDKLEQQRRARKRLDMDTGEPLTPEQRIVESEQELEKETFHCQDCEFSTTHRPALLSHIRHNHPDEGE